jgi:putative endopeptidase
MKANLKLVAALLVASTLTALAADQAKPLYGAWGYDQAGADLKTKPGDDFFRYANGTWLDNTPIPPDRSYYSLRTQMTERIEAHVHEILEAASNKQPTDLEGKIGAFYRSFMDEARVNALGHRPLEPLLQDVRNAKSRESLAALMGRSNADLEGSLFKLVVDVDLKNPNRYAVHIKQSGLGLPGRDYYLEASFAPQKAKYEAYVSQLLQLAHWDGHAKDVVDFETRIAEASWTQAEQRDPVKAYSPVSVAELERFAPGFAWKDYLGEAGLAKVTDVVLHGRSAFPKLAAIFAETPVETLQAWAAFHIADNAAPYLSRPFTDAHFEMHYKTLSGQQQPRARWKRAVIAVGGDFSGFGTFGTMGWGVGQLYSARYFPPETKAKIEELVANLRGAYRARIEKLDWMSTATKTEALKKLDSYDVKIGYPDHPRDYSQITMDADDLLGNVRRAGAADWAFSSGRLPGPVDRSEWLMTPQTNNCYNGDLRDIGFPAGFLQAPIFDAAADPAINYGAAGGLIGHEFIHGLDDEGRQIDADGVIRDWWTSEDAAQFKARAKMLGEQYSAFQPIPGVPVKADLTMGENIADLGGLTLALDAYRASLKGKPAPVVDGLTGDQRVLLGWAQAWRGKGTDDSMRDQVANDPHPPAEFRVNGVLRNMDAWYAAFDVKPGAKFYVEPEKRVKMW